MTPGARVQAAITLLDEILQGVPAERALTTWARRSRFAGSKDRAAVRDYVFQALRCLRSYACLGGAGTGRGIMIGALRAAEERPEAYFTGDGHAPAPLSPPEVTAGHPPAEKGDLMDLPDWIIPLFARSLGSESQVIRTAGMLKTRAAVTVRVNTRKSTPEAAIDALASDGMEARRIPVASSALQITNNARRLSASGAYRDGLVELQDGASQAAMELLDIPNGASVLDYCAGGGGKTLALAARADAKWFAHDALPQRMKDLPARAKRAGVDVTLLDEDALNGMSFELVLCDVPCSGSGTWRRTPDAKWRLTRENLGELNRVQAGILDKAAGFVTQGGTLVYATCSILEDENEHQVAAFVEREPTWRVTMQQRFDLSEWGDGFFLAQLQRK